MRNRFWRVVPVAIVSVLTLCFMAGCEECPDFEEQQTGECALTGYVLDAISGDGISGAEVYIVGDGSTETDESGWFFIGDAPCGDVTVEVTAEGYIDLESELEIADGETLEQDFALVPLSEEDGYRFILSWGLHPYDLDSHMWVPLGSAYYHIYYMDEGYLDQEPYAQLDTDDTSSYGPETITIRKHDDEPQLSMDYYEGEYIYAVKHFSGELSIPESGAVVRIYNGNVLVRTISAPPGTAANGWYWYVGRLNCRTGAWTLVNTYSINTPASLAGGLDTK